MQKLAISLSVVSLALSVVSLSFSILASKDIESTSQNADTVSLEESKDIEFIRERIGFKDKVCKITEEELKVWEELRQLPRRCDMEWD